MRRASWIRLLTVLAVAAPIVLLAFDALSRPGGGHTFSGGRRGGGGSGGGGGGGGDLVFWVVWLVFRHPVIGIPLVIIGVIVYLKHGHKLKNEPREWATTPAVAYRPPESARSQLDKIRAVDPDFSVVLFEDFLYALYAQAHEARGSGKLSGLSAYLTQPARMALSVITPALSDVRNVVIGAMQLNRVHGTGQPSGPITVRVTFESNYTEVGKDGSEQSWYAIEHWTLSRDAAAKSKPPGQTDVHSCPNCGAARPEDAEPVCTYCDTRVDTGKFDWVVTQVAVGKREKRGPQLLGDTPERGLHSSTIVHREATERMGALRAKDPSFDFEALEARVRLIHGELNKAWSDRDWTRARPYVSDELFQTQVYWIDTYKQQGLTNRTDGARVAQVELAAVMSDKWFDAITVRVYANGVDYTVRDSDGTVVSGSKTRQRPYSEYWTLIRSAKTAKPVTTEPSCPQCGAQLKVSMTGVCEYCDAKITTGEFDWVLSRIEQDEAYVG